MNPEYTAVIFRDGDWFVGWCPEIKGANGQGKTRKECMKDLTASVETMLEYYRAEALKSAPPEAERTTLSLA